MTLAGLMSGLLGVASGALKMLAMDTCMGMPARVSAMTSNFMIGITAAAGAVVFFANGYIDPRVALFVLMLLAVGAEMLLRGVGVAL